MKNILILTASYGMGHKSVSNAIKEEIDAKKEAFNVEIADIYDITHTSLKDVGTKLYNNLTENFPVIYNTLYDFKKNNKNNLIDGILCNNGYKALYDYIQKITPVAVISTFPLCACIMSKIKGKYKLLAKHITIITDIADSWEWVYPNTDLYFVPSVEIKTSLVYKGIDNDIIKVTGIPVTSKFLSQEKPEKHTFEEKHLLMIGSGMSEKELSSNFLYELDTFSKIKTIIVCGRNIELYNNLSTKNFKTIKILGFVDNINELMDNALFLVTKPGGITLFEAINKNLPLIIKNTNIGQEKGNIAFIKDKKIGIIVNKNEDIIRLLEEYTNSPKKMTTFYKNIAIVKRSLKQSIVADCILENLT